MFNRQTIKQLKKLKKEPVNQEKLGEIKKDLVEYMKLYPLKENAKAHHVSIFDHIIPFIFSFRSLAAVAVFVLLIFFGNHFVSASLDSLPGEKFYEVKIFSEELRRVLARAPEKEKNLELQFAEERVREIEILLNNKNVDPNIINLALLEFRKNIEKAKAIALSSSELSIIDTKEEADAILSEFEKLSQADSLPGENLYGVKTLIEETESALADSAQEKSELELKFARRRIAEMQKILAQEDLDKEAVLLALEKFNHSVQITKDSIIESSVTEEDLDATSSAKIATESKELQEEISKTQEIITERKVDATISEPDLEVITSVAESISVTQEKMKLLFVNVRRESNNFGNEFNEGDRDVNFFQFKLDHQNDSGDIRLDKLIMSTDRRMDDLCDIRLRDNQKNRFYGLAEINENQVSFSHLDIHLSSYDDRNFSIISNICDNTVDHEFFFYLEKWGLYIYDANSNEEVIVQGNFPIYGDTIIWKQSMADLVIDEVYFTKLYTKNNFHLENVLVAEFCDAGQKKVGDDVFNDFQFWTNNKLLSNSNWAYNHQAFDNCYDAIINVNDLGVYKSGYHDFHFKLDSLNNIQESNEDNDKFENVYINLEPEQVSKNIICNFTNNNSEKTHTCFSHYGSCSGIASCNINIADKKDISVTWSSSCGGNAYSDFTNSDDQYLYFDCYEEEKKKADLHIDHVYFSRSFNNKDDQLVAEICNLGETDLSQDFYMEFNHPISFAQYITVDLSANSCEYLSFNIENFNIKISGDYYFYLTIDSRDQIDEYSEDNNYWSGNLNVDLVNENIVESVKCIFRDAYQTQTCSSDYGRCSGFGSCLISNIKAEKNTEAIWKTNCSAIQSQKFTKFDKNYETEIIEFDCAREEVIDFEASGVSYSIEYGDEKNVFIGKLCNIGDAQSNFSISVKLQIISESTAQIFQVQKSRSYNSLASNECSSITFNLDEFNNSSNIVDGYYAALFSVDRDHRFSESNENNNQTPQELILVTRYALPIGTSSPPVVN